MNGTVTPVRVETVGATEATVTPKLVPRVLVFWATKLWAAARTEAPEVVAVAPTGRMVEEVASQATSIVQHHYVPRLYILAMVTWREVVWGEEPILQLRLDSKMFYAPLLISIYQPIAGFFLVVVVVVAMLLMPQQEPKAMVPVDLVVEL
jgi:hypothetical protein